MGDIFTQSGTPSSGPGLLVEAVCTSILTNFPFSICVSKMSLLFVRWRWSRHLEVVDDAGLCIDRAVETDAVRLILEERGKFGALDRSAGEAASFSADAQAALLPSHAVLARLKGEVGFTLE